MVAFTWQNTDNDKNSGGGSGSVGGGERGGDGSRYGGLDDDDDDDTPQTELPISCSHQTTGKNDMHCTCEVLNMPEMRNCTHAENL
jgi:hypothetical protein